MCLPSLYSESPRFHPKICWLGLPLFYLFIIYYRDRLINHSIGNQKTKDYHVDIKDSVMHILAVTVKKEHNTLSRETRELFDFGPDFGCLLTCTFNKRRL